MISDSADVLPTASAREHRLQIFQPTRRPVFSRRTVETAWGRVSVAGRLGQVHADVLDAICHFAEARGELADGRVKVLVDPFAVRRACGLGGEQLHSALRDLVASTVEIHDPPELECLGHLIDHLDFARAPDGRPLTRPNPLGGGARPMWRVELGRAYCTLLSRDGWLRYDPSPIARLRHGISQSLARHVLSHRHAPRDGWHVDGLLAACGCAPAQLRDRRREIRRDAPGLERLGIRVAEGRVFRGGGA